MRVDGKSYNVEEPPAIDHRRKHLVEVVVDRVVVRANQRTRIADAVEAALDLGRGVLHVAHVDDAKPEPEWRVERYSQHFACDQLRPQFRAAQPAPFFVQQSARLVPDLRGARRPARGQPGAADPRCEALAARRGRWPPGRTWRTNRSFLRFAEAIARHVGFSLDTPFEQLTPAQQRAVLHGTGEAWIPLDATARADDEAAERSGDVTLPVQGLFPPSTRRRASAPLPAAARSSGQRSPLLRLPRLALRDDAAAVPLPVRGEHTDARRTGRPAARRDAGAVQGTEADEGRQQQVAGELLREIRNRLQFLVDVGLDYLTLGRPAPTLSGGESQRIRLASQIGSGLTGVLYVLDEPTIGLHPRDNRRLLERLQHLRDLGNTLILVEHDREVIARGRLPARLRPRRRRPRRRDHRPRHAEAGAAGEGVADRTIPLREEGDSRADESATCRRERRQCRTASVRWSSRAPARTTCKNIDVAFPARRLHRRHRRQRLGQEFAGQRGPVQDAGPPAAPRPHRRPPPTTTSSAWSRSTRSSTSIRTRSATRRRPTRRPTPASST